MTSSGREQVEQGTVGGLPPIFLITVDMLLQSEGPFPQPWYVINDRPVSFVLMFHTFALCSIARLHISRITRSHCIRSGSSACPTPFICPFLAALSHARIVIICPFLAALSHARIVIGNL